MGHVRDTIQASAFRRELETHLASSAEMEGEICACVSWLAATLKDDYAEGLNAGGGHASNEQGDASS